MDQATGGKSLYPSHRTKILHLVRHAQGIHNVAVKKDPNAAFSDEFFDAKLTPLGWNQVDDLRKHVQACGLSKRIDLVITSPLLRTMQTAAGVFGGEGQTNDVANAPHAPLMAANAGESGRPGITSRNCPPFLAVELCRERLGIKPHEKRRSVSEYQHLFPAIDFSLLESDEDTMWKPEVRETKEEVAARGLKFLNWLWTRKEKEIAIVSHYVLLRETLTAFGTDWHPSVRSEICKPFHNCELRSLVIVDTRKIPRGLVHLPNDIAADKKDFDKVIYEETGGQTLYPLHRTKTLHLVRHAQGIHNVASQKDRHALLSEEYFDAQLSPLGWDQVDNLRKHVQACGLSKRIDLVISSPLLRTMQTAVGVFGGGAETDDDVGAPRAPLVVATAGESGRPSQNFPPFLAVELCRECLGVRPCEKRRSISEYQHQFPAIDFSLIESDEDTLWKSDVRETKAEVAARGVKFLNWLRTRKEKEIAVVSHGIFLYETLKAFNSDCHPCTRSEICRRFENCELRSLVLVDRSLTWSDSSTTNYLPTDIVANKKDLDKCEAK